MSGGHFYHSSYTISSIADEMQDIIDTNHLEDEYGSRRDYSDKTINNIRAAIYQLNVAAVYMHAVDYLVTGDYAENSFNTYIENKIKSGKLPEQQAD